MSLPSLTCDVCCAEPAVGVAAVPGVPVSMAYGRDCLAANAHPYGIVVANTACAGGLAGPHGENGWPLLADFWREMIGDTLEHLGIPLEVFYLDVHDAWRDIDMQEADMLAQQRAEEELQRALRENGAG